MSSVITMLLSSGQFVVDLPLGDDTPHYSGGNANWETIARPRRKSLTNFTGQEPWTCTLKTVLNQWPNGDVEPFIRFIEDRMVRPDVRVEPDLLKLVGPAMAHADLTWVLTGVDDSGEFQRRPDGRRSRQELTLTFLEYVSPRLLIRAPSPAEAAQQRAGK